MSSPVVVGENIYLHQKGQRFTCLSVEDGSIRWTSEPYGKYWSMIHNGDKILALDETGDLLLIRANPERLEILDKVKVGNNAWAHVALHQGKLIVRDLNALKVFDWK
jgi:outer membrane protein assembly factor BamB